MNTLIRLSPILGCLAMGVMMWFMMRGMNHDSRQQRNAAVPQGADPATQEEMNLLRAEIALLKQDRDASKPAEPGAGL